MGKLGGWVMMIQSNVCAACGCSLSYMSHVTCRGKEKTMACNCYHPLNGRQMDRDSLSFCQIAVISMSLSQF